MLPIEEGCLAVIINSKIGNNGKEVFVGEFIGEIECYPENGMIVNPTRKDYWNIDRPINCETVSGIRLLDTRRVSESKLLRIDGGEFKEEETEELVLIEQGES